MTDNKLTKYLLGVLVIISCTMFVWTLNYISSTDLQTHSAITAFNG